MFDGGSPALVVQVHLTHALEVAPVAVMPPERTVEAAGTLRIRINGVLFRLGCLAPDLAAFFPQHVVRLLRRLRPQRGILARLGIGVRVFLTTIFEFGQGFLNIFLLLLQFVKLLPLGVELFQVLQQSLELRRFFRRQASEKQLAFKIFFLGLNASGFRRPVRRGDIRLPYSAVRLDRKFSDLLFQLLLLGVQFLFGCLCLFLVQKLLKFGFFGFQFGYGLLVSGGLDKRIYGGNVRFQFLLRQRLFLGRRRGRVHTVLFQVQPGLNPILAGIVPEAFVRAGEMHEVFIPRLGVRPHIRLGHLRFHGQPLFFHLPGGKRAHPAPAAKTVGRIIGGPELMVRRVNLFMQNGVRRPHTLVHDRDILPVGARRLHGLHFFITPGAVGRLHVGTENVLHPVVMPTLRLYGRRNPFLEVRQCFPVFQGFLYAVAHKLHKVLLGKPRDVERPVLDFLAQSLGFLIRQLRPLLPERYGGVRGHGFRDNFRGGQFNGLFSHPLPPPPGRMPRRGLPPLSWRGQENSPARPGPWTAKAGLQGLLPVPHSFWPPVSRSQLA